MLQSHIRPFVSSPLLLRLLLLLVLDCILCPLEANFDAGQVPLLAAGVHPSGLACWMYWFALVWGVLGLCFDRSGPGPQAVNQHSLDKVLVEALHFVALHSVIFCKTHNATHSLQLIVDEIP